MKNTMSRILLWLIPLLMLGCSSGGVPPAACPERLPPGTVLISGDSSLRDNSGMTTAGSLSICGLTQNGQLPNLKKAHWLIVRGPVRVELDVPVLESVTSGIELIGGVGLTADALTTVGDLSIKESAQRTALRLPSLREAGELAVGLSGQLELASLERTNTLTAWQFSAPVLKEAASHLAGRVLFDGAQSPLPMLETTGFASLRFVGVATGTVSLPLLTSADQLVMTGVGSTLSLAALSSVSRLEIRDMENLKSLDMPNLTWVNELSVINNPRLSGCQIDALIAQAGPNVINREGNGPPCS